MVLMAEMVLVPATSVFVTSVVVVVAVAANSCCCCYCYYVANTAPTASENKTCRGGLKMRP